MGNIFAAGREIQLESPSYHDGKKEETISLLIIFLTTIWRDQDGGEAVIITLGEMAGICHQDQISKCQNFHQGITAEGINVLFLRSMKYLIIMQKDICMRMSC